MTLLRKLLPSQESRFALLFVSLILLLAVPSFLQGRALVILIPVLWTVNLTAALIAVAERRITVLVGLALGIPAAVLNWLDPLIGAEAPGLLGEVLSLAFLIFLTGAILRRVLDAEDVTNETLFGAADVYLLLALTWSTAYVLTEVFIPGSFAFTGVPGEIDARYDDRGTVVYFSFVTLTTLGYGDIVPVSDVARTLAMLEAIFGQLFLVFLIARLVGLHTALSVSRRRALAEERARKRKEEEEEEEARQREEEARAREGGEAIAPG